MDCHPSIVCTANQIRAFPSSVNDANGGSLSQILELEVRDQSRSRFSGPVWRGPPPKSSFGQTGSVCRNSCQNARRPSPVVSMVAISLTGTNCDRVRCGRPAGLGNQEATLGYTATGATRRSYTAHCTVNSHLYHLSSQLPRKHTSVVVHWLLLV